MSLVRRIARPTSHLAALALAASLAACGEQGRFGTAPGGGTGGTTPGPEVNAPTVQILQPATANFPVGVGDSVFVQVRVSDDRGVVSVDLFGVAQRGDRDLGTDTLVTRFFPKSITLPVPHTDTTLTRYLLAVPTDSTSEIVQLIVAATDSSGKVGLDTAFVRITSGPRLTLVRPTDGAVSSVGKDITIEVVAIDPQGVRVVGWRTSGVLTRADSIIVPTTTGVLPDTVTFVDTLTIPAGTATGSLVVVPFASDSGGDPSGTPRGNTVTIQSAASDATAPLVTFAVSAAKRVEVDDSVTINATDPSGISRVGFVVRQVGSPTIVAADSVALSGQQTDVTQVMRLLLDTITTYPRLVTVEAFAVDAAGNRGLSSRTATPVPGTGQAALDTVTVVAGRTFVLPAGGELADAIYNRNRNEIYFSNIARDRIEVFDVTTSTFLAGGIPVGSRPWGLALWPRDTVGTYGDTIIVANSGGTNLSIVDLVSRREVRRHRLPNYLIEKVRTEVDPNTGFLKIQIEQFDFSDRPQFVGAACRSACANVFAVYSTTPTPAQSQPLQGYLAWEELTSAAPLGNGHFFWEHATGPASRATDTLQVIAVRDSLPGVPLRDTILGGGVGIMADFDQLVFQDTTLVRNSGDFNHAVMGEGGLIEFARALTWDARAGVAAITGTSGTCSLLGFPLNCNGRTDLGISPGILVRDFVANRAARVRSVATNFNGLTNFVRADSIYAFDLTLRQTGLLQVSGVNPGMDVHPSHDFDARSRGTGGLGGAGNPDQRLLYAARADANIEVFDTYFFGSITILPVRDTIIGQLRLAQSATGQVLIGVTTRGIVVVPLTTPITNPFPIRADAQQQAPRPSRRNR